MNLSSSSSSSSRPLLVFKHNPKAGGGSIQLLLSHMKNKMIHFRCLTDCKQINGNNPCKQTKRCAAGDKQQSYSQWKNSTDTLLVLDEPDFLSDIFQKDAYVISSIREPCDHYVSCWAFGSAHHGGMYGSNHKRDPVWTEKAYGKDPPRFDSERDIHAFQTEWLRDSRVQGVIGRRHHAMYGDKSTLQNYPVDCWVFVDDFQSTLYSCLRQYEAQGGFVNWTTPIVMELVQSLQQKLYPTRRMMLEDKRHGKNDVVENPQQYHHAKCSIFFDKETADMVRFGTDSFIYDTFGYDGCCQGRTHKNPLVLPPPPDQYNITVWGKDQPALDNSMHKFVHEQDQEGKFTLYYLLLGCNVVSLLLVVSIFKRLKTWHWVKPMKYTPVETEEHHDEL
jgi:hypothetical protein